MTSPHGETWEDSYSWMSKLNDNVSMRHMDVYMEQEEKYTEAVLSDTLNLQSKLQSEIASRLPYDLSSPPFLWGPWSLSLFFIFFFVALFMFCGVVIDFLHFGVVD